MSLLVGNPAILTLLPPHCLSFAGGLSYGDVGRQPDLVQPLGRREGELHLAHRGVVRVGGHRHIVIAGDDLPLLSVLQLQHHLGADGPPALLRVLGPVELAAQGGADYLSNWISEKLLVFLLERQLEKQSRK